MQYSFGNLERVVWVVADILIVLSSCFFLSNLDFWNLITLKLFEEIVSRDYNLFAIVANSHWISAQYDIFDSLWTITFETSQEIFLELQAGH